MKSKLNMPADDQLEFYMLYDKEERIFDQEKRCFPALCKSRWVSRVNTLTWLLKHYENVFDIFQEIQDKQMYILMPPHTNQRFKILKFQYM